MSSTALLVATGALGTKLNAANTGTGINNADGSFNATGTVIGISQTTHALFDFITQGQGKIIPTAGIAVGIAGAYDSGRKIFNALSDGTPVQGSDIAVASRMIMSTRSGFRYSWHAGFCKA